MSKKNLQPNQIPRTVWLRPHQLESLRNISETTKIPQAVIVREGVDFVIRKYKEGNQSPRGGKTPSKEGRNKN